MLSPTRPWAPSCQQALLGCPAGSCRRGGRVHAGRGMHTPLKPFLLLHDSLPMPPFPSLRSQRHKNQICDVFLSIFVGQETPGKDHLSVAHLLKPCDSRLWQVKKWRQMSFPSPGHQTAAAEKWQEGTEEGRECWGLDLSEATPVSFPTARGLAVFS